ncbi:MAG: nitrilase family protein [Bacteroidales bacterium]|nr:nitrilase family protein [Bacteroidales bacterium]MBO6238554.1 nitrilase family protein [Bacteroidales bacterium]
MKITMLQTDPVWADPAANRREVERILLSVPPTDLIVLPEMFSTGFVTRPEGVAESDDSESLHLMKRLSRERSCAVAGSLSVREGESYRNRFYFVWPDGRERHYDKHHLFSFGGEHLRYTAGGERTVVEYGGFRILLQVCYDLRFPVFSRNRMTENGAEYDLILYVASWPEPRIAAWDALLKARAIENLCFVAGVNRVGEDPDNRYPGHSTLYGPRGEMLTNCKENKVDYATFDISHEDLKAFRTKFPALLDAD